MRVLVFVTGYLVASFIALLSLVATQAMSGEEPRTLLILGYTVGWSVLYGLGGGLPTVIERSPNDSVGVGFVSFGAGGAVGGALVGLMMVTDTLGGSPLAALATLALPFTVPWVIGGMLSLLQRSE